MIERKNAYFETIRQIGHEHEEKRVKRQERKKQIIAAYGWESEELAAWYEEDSKVTYPIPQGVCKAYRAWMGSISRQEDEVEMEDFLWPGDVQDFVDAFKAAGIKTFVYTNQSTAVMENLHQLVAAGCRMEGLCTITRRENRWGDEEPVEVQGIRFLVG